MLITSLENDRIKNYIKLKDRKYRKKTRTFIVEGMHLVLEAYKKGIDVDDNNIYLIADECIDVSKAPVKNGVNI